jgi:membrane fusion protein, multidrug efflux system
VATEDGIRLLFRSYETAAISSEINARITYLPAREGDRIRKGDVLVRFDCRKIVAEHDAATATFDASRIVYENQVKMLQYRAAGALAVEQSRFEMKKFEAEVAGLKARREGCVILAPFDCRIAEKAAQVHEIAQPNQPLIRIVNDTKIEMVLMAPSSWSPSFATGKLFRVKVDETGETYSARVVQSTGLIDPVSQSVRVIGELVGNAPTVLPGMSGTAVLTSGEASR